MPQDSPPGPGDPPRPPNEFSAGHHRHLTNAWASASPDVILILESLNYLTRKAGRCRSNGKYLLGNTPKNYS